MPTIGTRGAISARGFGWSGGVSPRGAPSSLNASLGSPSNSVISLTWTNGDVLAQTQVFRNDVIITTINAGTSTYSDTGLAENTTFTYKVRHTRNNLVSANSATDSETTDFPFRLSYAGTSSAVWEPGEGANVDLGFASGSWTFTVNKARTVTIRGCGTGAAGQTTSYPSVQGNGGGGGAFHQGFSYTLATGVTYSAVSGSAGSATASSFSNSSSTILSLGSASGVSAGAPIVGGTAGGNGDEGSGGTASAGTGGGGRGGNGNYGGSGADAGTFGGNGETSGGAGQGAPNGYDGGSGGFGGSFVHGGQSYGRGGGGSGQDGDGGGNRTLYTNSNLGGVIGIRT